MVKCFRRQIHKYQSLPTLRHTLRRDGLESKLGNEGVRNRGWRLWMHWHNDMDWNQGQNIWGIQEADGCGGTWLPVSTNMAHDVTCTLKNPMWTCLFCSKHKLNQIFISIIIMWNHIADKDYISSKWKKKSSCVVPCQKA